MISDELIQRCSVVSEVLPARKRQIHQRSVKTKCIYYKVIFFNKTGAFLHAARDHKDVVVKCHTCKLCFFSRDDLHSHSKEFHYFNETCVYCKHTNKFKSRGQLRQHIKSHHKADKIYQFARVKCFKFYKTQTELNEHEKDVHTSKADEIDCDICKVRVLRPQINDHMRQFHNRSRISDSYSGEKTTCCYCQKTFPSKGATVRHVKVSHSNIKTFNCYTCSLYFPNIDLKQIHFQKVHRGNFICIYCNWSCAYRSNLRRHLREKHQGQVFQCRYKTMCALYFKTNDDLQKHIEESHENDKTSKVQCVYCQKFMEHKLIRFHVNKNHNLVAIRCNFTRSCLTYFLSKDDHKEHVLQVHHGKVLENLNCSQCSNVYTSFYNLKSHTLKAHGVLLLKCSERNCGFICRSREMLRQHHQEQHGVAEKLKIFSCKFCNYKAKYAEYVERHIFFKHGTENKKCPLLFKEKL
jgi:hypothetical protein